MNGNSRVVNIPLCYACRKCNARGYCVVYACACTREGDFDQSQLPWFMLSSNSELQEHFTGHRSQGTSQIQ